MKSHTLERGRFKPEMTLASWVPEVLKSFRKKSSLHSILSSSSNSSLSFFVICPTFALFYF